MFGAGSVLRRIFWRRYLEFYSRSPVVLKGFPLQGKDFSELQIRGVVLLGADLSGAILLGADLREGQLRGAILTEANLIDSDLRYADFKAANMGKAVLLEALASHVDFEDCIMPEADCRGISAPNSRWNRADLTRARLSNAEIPESQFVAVKCEGVEGVGLALDFSDVRMSVFQNAKLTGAEFMLADCRGVNFNGALLRGADFHGSALHMSRLEGADLTGANLEEADLSGASIVGAILDGANLEGASIPNLATASSFARARITFGTVQRSNWSDRDVIDLVERGVRITGLREFPSPLRESLMGDVKATPQEVYRSPESQLEDFLANVFDHHELKRFIREQSWMHERDRIELINSLPDETSSSNLRSARFVEGVVKRGVVVSRLFNGLRQSLPSRIEDVDIIEKSWPV